MRNPKPTVEPLEPRRLMAAGDEVIVDNLATTRAGTWTASSYDKGYYATNYLHDGAAGKGTQRVVFAPVLPAAGTYEVFARHTASANRSTAVPHAVKVASGATVTATVNQRLNGGQWVSLGTHALAATGTTVTVSNAGTTGYVVADAVRFVEVGTPAPVPPAAPTGLAASPTSATTVALSWADASTNESGFAIERAPGGAYAAFAPLATVGANVVAYTDATAQPETSYAYRLRATNAAGASPYSNVADATTPAVPPPGEPPAPGTIQWFDLDIGAVKFAGSSSTAGDVVTVSGSGADIFGRADQFHYAYTPLKGDGTITARVTGVQATNANAKAGVMIRESLAANSRHVTAVVKPSGFEFERRTTTGGTTAYNATAGVAAPHWVRLRRTGNVIAAFRSADGVTWTPAGSVTVAMAADVYVGLAVTAHDNTKLNTSTFDRVTIERVDTPAFNSAVIGAPPAPGQTTILTEGRAYAVRAVGGQVGGTVDGLRMLGRSIGTAFDVMTRVDGLTTASAGGLAGMAVRAGTGSGAPNVVVGVTATGYRLSYRKTLNGPTTVVAGPAITPGEPTWVRLTRRDSYFTAYHSADGANWTLIDNAYVPQNIPPTALVGPVATGGGGTTPAETSVTFSGLAGFGLDPSTPAAPTGLVATATADGRVTLAWADHAHNEDQYVVERRAGANGTWARLADVSRNSTAYADAFRVRPSTEYAYRVRAANGARGANASVPSNVAMVMTPAALLPDPWRDVGLGGTGGAASGAGGQFEVQSTGAGVAGSADAMRFVHRRLYGDGAIVARVAGFAPAGAGAVAGLVARETLAASSAFAGLFLTGNGTAVAASRATAGANTTFGDPTTPDGETWLRIARAGDLVTTAFSADGLAWTTLATASLDLRAELYVGLAVASGDGAVTQSATFADVSFAPVAITAERDWTPLFNGTDLTGFYPFLPGAPAGTDPKGVFRVEGGAIRVLDLPDDPAVPQDFGYLSTTDNYANYRLRLQYKWGEKKFAPRQDAVRDAGLLYHAAGPDAIWPTSSELQIQEGDTGDLWLLGGARATARVRNPASAEPQFAESGTPHTVPPGTAPRRVVKGQTVESLTDWNTVEVIVSGDDAVHLVNGVLVNEAFDLTVPDPADPTRRVPRDAGRIMLQAEGAEVFYRNIEIQPLAFAPAPAGATTLFDGTDTAQWRHRDGTAPIQWPVSDGAMTVNIGSGYIETVQDYGDAHLHLEFKTPYEDPSEGEQGRGNSGIYLQGRYEVQILDSFAGPVGDHNDVGAIYSRVNPSVNAGLPPGVWQSYDIYFRAARYAGGAKVADARVSAFLNGVLVLDDVAVAGTTTLGDPEGASLGPIVLQDSPNSGAVSYRNIWVKPS